MFAVFAGALFPQDAPKPKSDVQTQWQATDQLCGQLELAASLKKQIMVNGTSELRLYSAYLENATANLYRAPPPGEECCTSKPIATTRSRRFGAFEFEGVQPGTYWLRVQKNEVLSLIPVRVTHGFDKKACHDPSVGRSFVVDSSPPQIKTRKGMIGRNIAPSPTLSRGNECSRGCCAMLHSAISTHVHKLESFERVLRQMPCAAKVRLLHWNRHQRNFLGPYDQQ